jgi:hypothetical protein
MLSAVVGMLALPVTAIAKAVSLAKDVESNRKDAVSALTAHEKLCEERMRNLAHGQEQILAAVHRLGERIDGM